MSGLWYQHCVSALAYRNIICSLLPFGWNGLRIVLRLLNRLSDGVAHDVECNSRIVS